MTPRFVHNDPEVHLAWSSKFFTLQMGSRMDTVSIDHLKAVQDLILLIISLRAKVGLLGWSKLLSMVL